jgi:hypothetical protein
MKERTKYQPEKRRIMNTFQGVITAGIISLVFCTPTTKPVPQSQLDISGEFSSPPSGCSNFSVYISNRLKSKWIAVDANQSLLDLSTDFKTFTIGIPFYNINVHYDYYSINKDSTRQQYFLYCNDVGDPDAQSPEVWKAIDGFIDVKRSEIQPSGIFNLYSVTLKLRNIHFVDSLKMDTLFLKELEMDTVAVGWLPG